MSLNRYERKKNIDLAILAFAKYLQKQPEKRKSSVLVVAGGWDERVVENVEHEKELRMTARELQVE